MHTVISYNHNQSHKSSTYSLGNSRTLCSVGLSGNMTLAHLVPYVTVATDTGFSTVFVLTNFSGAQCFGMLFPRVQRQLNFLSKSVNNSIQSIRRVFRIARINNKDNNSAAVNTILFSYC